MEKSVLLPHEFYANILKLLVFQEVITIRKVCLILLFSILVLSGCGETIPPTDGELIGEFASHVDAQHRDIEDGSPITEQSLNFIDENIDIFMNHEETPEELINSDIDYRHLGKDIKKYSGTLFRDSGVILNIQEVEAGNLDKIFSIIHVQNPKTSTDYDVLYIGQVDLLEEDYIEFVALPLMDTQFANIGGGTTKSFMMLASHLEKIE